jgi:ribosomal protein L11 methyltransferase
LPEDAPKVKTEIVFANILAGPLVELKDSILSYLLPDGLLVLSGILASQAQDVAKAYEDECNIISIEEDEGWVRIYAQRKA